MFILFYNIMKYYNMNYVKSEIFNNKIKWYIV